MAAFSLRETKIVKMRAQIAREKELRAIRAPIESTRRKRRREKVRELQEENLVILMASPEYVAEQKQKRKSYYIKHKDKKGAYAREYMKNADNYKRAMLNRARYRAEQKGLQFDLKVADIFWPTHCPVFNFEFVYATGDRRTSPSLDRIDSIKGYTPDNVQIISGLANVMKQDATAEKLKQFAHWILEK